MSFSNYAPPIRDDRTAPFGRSWNEIFTTMMARRSADTPLIARMLDTRDRYNGDVVVPLRDVDSEPDMKPLAPQVIRNGIEHTAMRANAAEPSIMVPAVNAGRQDSALRRAQTRRRALYSTWWDSGMSLLRGRAYRHLAGYGTFAMLVVPDFVNGRARIELRDPLTAYPELRSPGDFRAPLNVGFVYGRSPAWIKSRYGQAVLDRLGPHPQGDGLWDMVEWIDETAVVLGVLGPRSPEGLPASPPQSVRGAELRRWPNRLGWVPVACPQRITLDRVAGQLEAITGMADWIDKLMALEVLAAERGVFPDMYVLSEDNRAAQITAGEWQDGRTGNMNILENAKNIGQLVTTPGPLTGQIISALERAGQITGGVIPEYGGETASSLRTGRAIDTIGSFSVDPRIKEMQDIMANALSRVINPAILDTEKSYWPSKKFTVFSGWPADPGEVEYTPSDDFETTNNVVTYAFPGSDISQINVWILQAMGGKLISRKTGRRKHPMIDDAELEDRLVLEEALDDAGIQSVQQQVSAGALPLIDLAFFRQRIRAGDEWDVALLAADDRARQRQATQPEEAGEGEVGPPGVAPGLAMPGMGAEMGQMGGGPEEQAEIPPPAQSQQNLRAMFKALNAH